MLVSYYQPAVN